MTTHTAAAAVEITRTVQEASQRAGRNWADDVDAALTEAGYETLSPVTYGAEHDTRLVAVVQIDGRAVGIWGHDDGTWTSGPALIPWRDVTVWYADGGQPVTRESERVEYLEEHRDTDSILGAYLADPADYDADGAPLSGEGPSLEVAGPSRDEINWTGLDEAIEVAS